MDLVADAAEVVGPKADVVSDVRLDVQVADGQSGLLGGALDLVLLTCAIDDWLQEVERRWAVDGCQTQSPHLK